MGQHPAVDHEEKVLRPSAEEEVPVAVVLAACASDLGDGHREGLAVESLHAWAADSSPAVDHLWEPYYQDPVDLDTTIKRSTKL